MDHSWLLNTHIEAPVCGSAIAAGISFKHGGYWLLRNFFQYYLSLDLLLFWFHLDCF